SPGAGHSVLLRRFGTNIGAQFDFEIPSSGSTLNGPVRMRISGNTVEIAEAGGTLRGVRVDLTAAAANAGSDLAHTGNFQTLLDAILGARIAAMAFNAIGQVGTFQEPATATTAAGTVVNGSALIYAANNASVPGNPSGQWRRHGAGNAGGAFITTYQRVS
ncbi:MAG: hypothetical protein INH13_12340, partial [Cupriavidus sp.]|nr:hypothetical protein [Cupriavidus sp.]